MNTEKVSNWVFFFFGVAKGYKKFWRLNAFIFIDYLLFLAAESTNEPVEIWKLTNEIERKVIGKQTFQEWYVLPDYMFL